MYVLTECIWFNFLSRNANQMLYEPRQDKINNMACAPSEDSDYPSLSGVPVAKWVKRWPTDLAVPSSIPALGRIFSTVNRFHCTQPFISNLSSS